MILNPFTLMGLLCMYAVFCFVIAELDKQWYNSIRGEDTWIQARAEAQTEFARTVDNRYISYKLVMHKSAMEAIMPIGRVIDDGWFKHSYMVAESKRLQNRWVIVQLGL